MNHAVKLIVAGSLITSGFIGCGLLDPKDGPTCDFKSINVAGDVNAGGGAVKVTGTLEGSATITNLMMFVMTSSDDDVQGLSIDYDDASKEKINLETDCNTKISADASVPEGDYKLLITATVEEKEFSQSVTFHVNGESAVALTEKTDGIISNLWGPDEGAFNLKDGVRVAKSSASTTKDLLDLSLVGDGFKGKLGSGNGTKFATSNLTAYTNATDVSIKALATGAILDSVDVSSANTVFVANLGGSRGVAIVKITEYSPNAGTSTVGNKGEVKFSYKYTAN